MDPATVDAALASALRTFIDSLPRPILYPPVASARRLRGIIAPRAGLTVFALDDPGPAALAACASAAARTRSDVIAVSRHVDWPGTLRFDLILRRRAPAAIFTDYLFRATATGGLFTPGRSGPLVQLDAAGLTPGDEVYFQMTSGRLAALDRAAGAMPTRDLESI